MPLDAMLLRGLCAELKAKTDGSRIDKIQQPEKDAILLSIRGASGNFRMLLSAFQGSSRVHITKQSFENPPAPPMFCMLLRKHLSGARILDITQPFNERILEFKLSALDEMGNAGDKHLIVEMIGHSANIILTDGQGIIIDCLRRISLERNESRQVLPGLLYRLPKAQDKLGFLNAEYSDFERLWNSAPPEAAADKWMLETFSGLSPLVCRELCSMAFGETSPRICEIPEEVKQGFPAMLDKLSGDIERGKTEACMLLEGELPRDFSFVPINQYGDKMSLVRYPSFSEMLDSFYGKRDKAESMKRRSHELKRQVKTARDRQLKKLGLQKTELLKTADRETMRKYGDLITANLYRMKKGEAFVTVQDYYEEGMPEVTIKLNILKTPPQNAAAYYKEYNKAKSAEKYLGALIEDGEARLLYLESVLTSIDCCQLEADLSEIRSELLETGYIKKQKQSQKKRPKDKKSSPRRFISSSGFEILVGRSNLQNDVLTLKIARRTDMWLHTQKVHGSHVIISCEGQQPDDQTVNEAASLAVYFSQGRDGGKIPVDYTQVRNVKKPSGSLPGMVIYSSFKTVMAVSDDELANKLSVK